MEVIELVIFLILNVMFIAVSLWRKFGLLNVLGILGCLLFLPLSLKTVVYRNYVSNGLVVQEHIVYANPSLMALIMAMFIFAHALILLKIKRGL